MAADNRGPILQDVIIFLLVLTWVFVALRLYCRLAVVKEFKPDDYFCVIAQIFFTLHCAFSLNGIHYGTGQHFSDITPPTNIPIALRWWWMCEPTYVVSNTALKISVGLALLNIFVFKTQKIILWLCIVASTLTSVYLFFLFIFQCWPVTYFWEELTGATGTCINPDIVVNSTYAYSALTCVVDWTLCIIPGIFVWKLQMNRQVRISVLSILALGSIASTATVVRLAYVKDLTNRADFLYATVNVAIWSITETALGIVASASATLHPLLRKFNDRRGSSDTAKSAYTVSTADQSRIRGSSGASGATARDRLDSEEMGLDRIENAEEGVEEKVDKSSSESQKSRGGAESD